MPIALTAALSLTFTSLLAGALPAQAYEPPARSAVHHLGIQVAAAEFEGSPVPVVTGKAEVGSTLTAVPGVWGPEDVDRSGPVPVTLAYQWFRSGVAIVGATGSTYVPVFGDLAASLTVQVTGSRAGYVTVVRTSAGTAPVAVGWAVPTISGTVSVGSTLTALPGSGVPAGVTLGYQWFRYGVALVGATAATYVPVSRDYYGTLTVQVTRSRPGYPAESKTSLPTVRVLRGTLVSPVPTVTGTAKIGSTLTMDPGNWGPSPLKLSYSWSGSGRASGSTYVVTGADAGKALTVTVTGTKSGYYSVRRESAPTAVVPTDAFSTAPVPVVTGKAEVGSTLTAVPGVWGPEDVDRSGPVPVTLAYQWFRSGVAIVGATGSTYVPVFGDLAASLTVQVTGSRAGYVTVVRTSAGTAPVAVGWAVPTISGTVSVGSTLTALPGSGVPAGVTLGYQWFRYGVALVGATAATYVPVSRDYYGTLTVQVTRSRPGYPAESKTSLPTVRVLRGTLVSPVPTVTGTAKIGSTLTMDPGNWGPSPLKLSYSWSGSGRASGSTYVVTGADAGKALTVTVTGTKSGYYSVRRESAPTAVVPTDAFSTAPVPVVTGKAEVGSTLTAVPGVWGPEDVDRSGPVPVTLAYQWFRSGVAIVGATGSTYVPVFGDLAASLTVQVTGSRAGYVTVVRTSAGTAPVAVGWAVPTISGTVSVGSTLTALPGSGVPAGVTLGYQWFRYGVALVGATAATYVPVSRDYYGTLTVQVTRSRPGYPAESKTSLPTVRVLRGTLVSPVPTVTGTAKIGSTLTMDPGNWGPSPLKLSYSWSGSGRASGSTYVVTGADAGKALTVTVTGTKSGYYSVRRESAPTAVVPPGTFGPAPVPSATASPSASPTASATPTATASPTATVSPTATATPTATASPSVSPTATATPTATASPPATASPSASPPATASPSASPPATASPSASPPATASPSASPTATDSPSASPTAANSSPSATATATASPTATATASPTTSRTPIPEASPSRENHVASTLPASVGKGNVEPQASVQAPLPGTQFDSAPGTDLGYPAVESPVGAAIPSAAPATPDAAPDTTTTPGPSAKPSEPVVASASQASSTGSFPLLQLVLTVGVALLAAALVWFARRRGTRAGG
ncbi:hypothetical protein NicSoilC12_29440 [Arthrobacter sp. NicSoilC12]|nr:hypothetical protein NicSoilC12_29440 [Arthrobacter sp. NicSoilC12]